MASIPNWQAQSSQDAHECIKNTWQVPDECIHVIERAKLVLKVSVDPGAAVPAPDVDHTIHFDQLNLIPMIFYLFLLEMACPVSL